MQVAAWQFWLLLALAFVVLDIGLAGGASGVLLILALASAGAMVAAGLGFEMQVQFVTAGVVAAASTPLVVWLLRRLAWQSADSAGVDLRVAGQTFEVVRQRDRIGIRVQAEFFPARLEDGGEPLPGGQVRVLRFEGITAIVRAVAA